MITECEDCKYGSASLQAAPLEEDLAWVRESRAQTPGTDAVADGGRKLRREVPDSTFRRLTRAACLPKNRISTNL